MSFCEQNVCVCCVEEVSNQADKELVVARTVSPWPAHPSLGSKHCSYHELEGAMAILVCTRPVLWIIDEEIDHG